MGNAADCDYCDNFGKVWSFGCPKCGRFDARPQQDAKYDREVKQYKINSEVEKRVKDVQVPRTS